MTTIQQTVQHYRKQLKAHETQAERFLEQSYRATLAAIQPALDHLYDQMVDAMANGEKIPLSWLYEAQRIENIKKLIQNEMDHFGGTTHRTVQQITQAAAQMGTEAAQNLMQATVPEGVSWTFGRPMITAIQNIAFTTQAGTPLRTLFDGFGALAAKQAADALIRGVALGYNPRKIAGEVAQALNEPRARALTIARTEMLRSYRMAQLENFRANDDVVQGWTWQAYLDVTTCAACIMMNGTKHPLSEEMASHVNCRCTQLPETKSWEDILGPLGIDTSGLEETSIQVQSGQSWFEDQDEKTQQTILGPAKYQAWQDGQFDLQDLIGYTHDPQWGKSVKEMPLKDLVGAK